jgi:hypothetical protein
MAFVTDTTDLINTFVEEIEGAARSRAVLAGRA